MSPSWGCQSGVGDEVPERGLEQRRGRQVDGVELCRSSGFISPAAFTTASFKRTSSSRFRTSLLAFRAARGRDAEHVSKPGVSLLDSQRTPCEAMHPQTKRTRSKQTIELPEIALTRGFTDSKRARP